MGYASVHGLEIWCLKGTRLSSVRVIESKLWQFLGQGWSRTTSWRWWWHGWPLPLKKISCRSFIPTEWPGSTLLVPWYFVNTLKVIIKSKQDQRGNSWGDWCWGTWNVAWGWYYHKLTQFGIIDPGIRVLFKNYMLLQAYFVQIESTMNKLRTVRKWIEQQTDALYIHKMNCVIQN